MEVVGKLDENKEIPVIDYDEMIRWIHSKTNIDKSIIECVLEAETEWMVHSGIIVDGNILSE